jgi:hypothetical protein
MVVEVVVAAVVSSIKFPVGTKFRPRAKLLASLNAFGSDPARTQSVQFPSGRMEKGSSWNTINKWPKEAEGNETVRVVLHRYVFVTFHRYLLL